MRGHKNPGTLEAEIRMLRTQRDWAVLVVEDRTTSDSGRGGPASNANSSTAKASRM